MVIYTYLVGVEGQDLERGWVGCSFGSLGGTVGKVDRALMVLLISPGALGPLARVVRRVECLERPLGP